MEYIFEENQQGLYRHYFCGKEYKRKLFLVANIDAVSSQSEEESDHDSNNFFYKKEKCMLCGEYR